MRSAEFKDGMVYFFTSDCPLSNFYFHTEGFEVAIDGIGAMHRFVTGEQYYQFRKCQFFEDYAIAKRILGLTQDVHINGSRWDYRSTISREAKRMGNLCKDFDIDRWIEYREDVMCDTLRHKFAPNVVDSRLRHPMSWHLYRTRYHKCVECSPHDRVWGIGLSRNDGRRFDRRLWHGKNLLGTCLDKVRDQMILSDRKDYDEFMAARDPIEIVEVSDEEMDAALPAKRMRTMSPARAEQLAVVVDKADACLIRGCLENGGLNHDLSMAYKYNNETRFDELYYHCVACDFIVLACEVADPNASVDQ